ncbi:Crp/Fnr family transcriptional regulator [Halomonas aquamarina]|uniref:Crp/Fnr family transcriptional regulator n=1 Tax=Vreelandella aquamarina TaxID=77097 RepID=A0ACC5VRT3_9GAMM|nr:Crp/Fnr family transcriptional regulator [Halomonas aquamarina]MBZ5486848.1 Crp/Fnr family transcriptional regulator [Halomonas aquamarina]
MPRRRKFQKNTLLGLLPEEELNRLLPHLEEVTLTLGQSLCEPGQPMEHAYFPLDAIVSLLDAIKNGSSTETAVVGSDGMVGVSLFMSDGRATSQAIVHRGGQALRLKGYLLKEEFSRAGPMQSLLLRYTQALLTQVAQTAVCNRHHNLDQQLCRWLLLHIDRWSNNELIMTQEMIANMLGVRREGVTETASKLQKAGLISYHRGHIKVVDRQGLEARVCECYAIGEEAYDRLLRRRKSHQ